MIYIPNPILFDLPPEGGSITSVTDNQGDLAGYVLLGLVGPEATVEISTDGTDWQTLTYPHTLAVGEQLRLSRTDTASELSKILAVAPVEGGNMLALKGSAADVASLPGDAQAGDVYLVTGHLYVWDGSAWADAGPVGVAGQDGAAATITVGTVTTGQPGTQASVTNSGTASAAVLDIVIPQGPKGDKGDKGEGVKGDKGDPGRGIATVGQTGGHLTGTYTDGTVWDAGMLPAGNIPDVENPNMLSVTAKLRALGDSITIGEQAGGADNAYPAKLAEIRKWSLQTNAGIGYSTLSRVSGHNPMVDRWDALLPADYDGHFVLFGGTNDWALNAALGNPGSTDPATVYGALLVMGRGILSKAPGCLLHLLTPLRRTESGLEDGTRNSAGYTLEQVRQAVRDVAAQLEREYPGRMQLHDVGRDTWDWFYPGAALWGDGGTHPNQLGQLFLAQHLAMQMRGADGVLQPAPTSYSRTFASLTAGDLNGQDGWAAYGSAQATINSSGLTLTAPFDSNARGVLHALPEGATRVAVRVSVSAVTNIILRGFHQTSNDLAVCAWIADGGLDFGTIQGNQVVGTLANKPVLPADCWLELTQNGPTYEVRYWDAASGTRPDTAQYTHANPNLTPDAFGFSTIGTDAQVIQSVSVS